MTHYNKQYVTDIKTKKGIEGKTIILTGDNDEDFDLDDIFSSSITDEDYGLLILKETTDSDTGVFLIAGGSIELLTGISEIYSTTKNSINKYNVYFENNIIKVQNKIGNNKNITIGIYKI